MNKISKILIISFIIATSVINSYSQGGSNYSVFGIGDIYNNASAYYEGLAGTSIAMPSDHAINTKNPAMWGLVSNTRLSAGYRFHQNYITTDDLKLYQNNGQVDGVAALFAIDTSLGISASFGIYPYSSVNYLISSPVDFKFQDLEVKGENTYQGSGGISTAYIGGSTKIFDNLIIGASIYANFGLITTSTLTVLENNYAGHTQKDSRFSGYGLRGGIYYSPFNNFAVGAYVEKQQTFNSKCLMTFYNNFIDDTTLESNEYAVKLPDSYGFGLSYLLDKFQFGLDCSFQDFTGFDFNEGPKTEYKNSTQFSIGVSRLGNKSYYAPYFDKITYNFGIGYKDLYYRITGKDGTKSPENISEYYASFGMKMPIVGTAVLDAAFVFGTRGTTDNFLVKEYFGKLVIDISIGETWFKPFKRGY